MPMLEAPLPSAAASEAVNHELETVLRHLIARMQDEETEGDTLLGAGAQLVFSTSGVRYMSLKSELEDRVQELVSVKALLTAALSQCTPEAQRLLHEAHRLVEQALQLGEKSTAYN